MLNPKTNVGKLRNDIFMSNLHIFKMATKISRISYIDETFHLFVII